MKITYLYVTHFIDCYQFIINMYVYKYIIYSSFLTMLSSKLQCYTNWCDSICTFIYTLIIYSKAKYHILCLLLVYCHKAEKYAFDSSIGRVGVVVRYRQTDNNIFCGWGTDRLIITGTDPCEVQTDW